MSEWRLVREEFGSFDQLLETLKRRPNNPKMQGQRLSMSGSQSFTGTKSYSEAVKMLGTGYLDVIPKMQRNLKEQAKLNAKYVETVEHPRPHNAVVGFIPNVPASLLNLPESMISNNRKPMKRKTLHIHYVVSGSCSRDSSYFIDAGTALLSAVDIIERSGIQTKIDLCFFASKVNREFPFPTICIKNYGERFSIQKVSFPLVHTSMFRRIGFKWIETTPDTQESYSRGYGMPPSHEEIEEATRPIMDRSTYVISTDWIARNHNDVTAILKKLEVI